MGIFTWGPTIQSTDTFNGVIGAINTVQYVNFKTVFDWAWQDHCNKVKMAILSKDTNVTRKPVGAHLVDTWLLPKGDIFKKAIIDTVTNDGNNIDDYILLYADYTINFYYNLTQVTDSTNVGGYIYLIHKEDFLSYCQYLSTKTVTTYASSIASTPAYYFFRYSSTSTFTLTHTLYTCNPQTSATNKMMDDTTFYNYIKSRITKTLAGAVAKPDIASNHANNNGSFSALTNNRGYLSLAYIYGAYGSSIKGQLDPGGTNEDDENDGPTPGTWTIPDDDDFGGPSGYDDLEASLFRVYAMNKTQLSNFSKSLWTPSILESLVQHLGRVEDLVIGLYSYPFEVEHDSSEYNINFNWLSSWGVTFGAKGYLVSEGSEIQTKDFGNITIPLYSGTFYDYQPFSSAQIYLPYIGFIPLKLNEILGQTLNLKYNINVTTGDFCAELKVLNYKNPVTGNTSDLIIGEYNGNMARPLPLSRQDMFEVYKAGATLLGATAGVVMGASTALAGAIDLNSYLGSYETLKGQTEIANSYAHQYNSLRQNPDYNDGRLMAYVNPPEKNTQPYQEEINKGIRKGLHSGANAITAVTQANAPIERSGNLGGVVGRCAEQTAFVLLSYPHQNIPKNQSILGYGTNAQGPLSNGFSGYTEVREIRIKDSNATSSELAEIEQIVKGGIII